MEVSNFILEKMDVKSMTFSEISKALSEILEKDYRVRQVYEWIVKGVTSFDNMTNIPKELREKLKQCCIIPNLIIKEKLISKDSTVKYLFKLDDGEYIESVVMKYKHGYSICLSTQVGCKMGCCFCQTGKMGFSRNLVPSEIISQIQTIQEDMNIKVSNIVLMGMGEPLDNYENVVKFLKLVSSKDHLNISMRHISLSTCGLVNKIYKLADEKIPITLSVSLHAPNDLIRSKIMKINRKWNINELLGACRYFINKTGRRISFEYVMIKNLNDSASCAVELAALLKGMLGHVNLIPLNKSEAELTKSPTASIYRFKNILESRGVATTIRRTLAEDIEGACGQLKGSYISKEV